MKKKVLTACSTERREFESRPSSQYCNKVTVRFSSVGRIWLHMLRISCSIPAAYTTRPRQSCDPGSTVWDKDMAMDNLIIQSPKGMAIRSFNLSIRTRSEEILSILFFLENKKEANNYLKYILFIYIIPPSLPLLGLDNYCHKHSSFLPAESSTTMGSLSISLSRITRLQYIPQWWVLLLSPILTITMVLLRNNQPLYYWQLFEKSKYNQRQYF